MTGAEFYAYVLRRFKRTDKSTEVYEAITDVIMDIKRRYFFEDFKAEAYTDAIQSLGDYKLTLPADFQHLIGTVMLIDDQGDGKPLRKVNKETFDEMFPNPNDADVIKDRPTHVCLFSGQLLLGHVPDRTTYQYQITYSTEEELQVTADTANVPFTDRYRDVLRNLVLAELYYGMGFDSEADKFKVQGEQGIKLMVAIDDHNVDAPTQQNYNDL